MRLFRFYYIFLIPAYLCVFLPIYAYSCLFRPIFTFFSAYFQGNLSCAQGAFAYNPRHYYCLHYHNHLKINRLQTKCRTLNCITLQRYNFFLKYANYYSCISNLKVIYSVTTAVLTVSAERVVRRNAERELNANIKGASC